MNTATATRAVATLTGAETPRPGTATRRSGPAAAGEGHPDRQLATVPRPAAGETHVDLEPGTMAGGLQAVRAQWGPDGGTVQLAGRAPFTELAGTAAFRADGSLSGEVHLRANLALAGQVLGKMSWQVHGWHPGRPLALPATALRGSTLAVDLRPLPAGSALTPVPGINAEQGTGAATVHLPANTIPPGEPLNARLAEIYRGLGIDTGALRVHPDVPAAGVPAFVSNHHLFLAPGVYGVDSPGMLAVLDQAIHAALAGLAGPVAARPAPASTEPSSGEEPPAADTGIIHATPAGPVTAGDADQPGSAAPQTTAAETTAAPAGPGTTPAAGEGSTGEAGAQAAEGQAPVPVELLMPPAPSTLGPQAAERGRAVSGGARRASRAARTLPDADADVADSRGAVTEPPAETAARAQEELAAELGARPAPSPEIEALCLRIETAIRENRPEDEDELLETDPTQEARDAGATITGSVRAQSAEVGHSFDALATPPPGHPALTPTPVQAPRTGVRDPGIDAARAAPDPIPPENTSLEADVAATDQRIAASGIDTRVTRAIPDGPFGETRAARAELGEAASATPAAIQDTQQQAIDTAQTDMAALQTRALDVLRASRSGTIHRVGGAQGGMVTHEEATRETVAARAQVIYTAAAGDVAEILRDLNSTAMGLWEAGLEKLSGEFHDAVDHTQREVDERHSGIGGALLSVGDYLTGLPDWVTAAYNRAETDFTDGVCTLLRTISTTVNGVVAAAQARINRARTAIDDAFATMEGKFPDWAAEQRAHFSGMLDGLAEQATDAQTSFVTDVSARAIQAVNEVHAEVQALREAAGGLIGRVATAIAEFVEDPARAIINGLLRLVGIPPAAFWALVAKIEQVISDIADDPENFINNLVAGLKQGFTQFFNAFGRHVLEGFWTWLFSGLQTPIPMPRDLSAGALFGFALELMGITWPRVREILVRHVGPTAVEVIEATWELVTTLIERGPEGIVELIKDQLTPESLIDTILDAAVDYLVETLIQQAIIRVAGLLNPVGAIAQAIDMIYQVCAWVFRNAARIFSFVETVVNGLADVVAGNIGALAAAVERSLAQLIPPVIDFLAGMCHLGGLPDEVAQVIVRLQAVVYRAMDRVVGFLAERGRALLARLGVDTTSPAEEETGHDDELGTTVRFRADGESHRLWYQTRGTTGELMVASTPEPLERRIAAWRAKIPNLPEAEQGAATAAVNELAALADDADELGDQLTQAFLAAERDSADELEPPDDAGLEARERALVDKLRTVIGLFGEEHTEEDYLADIAANLPAKGRSYARTIAGQWMPTITRPQLAPPGNEPIWGPADIQDHGALALLAQDATRRELLPWFLVGRQRNPRSAASGTFRSYVFENLNPEPDHPVRAWFLARMGQDTAAHMRATGAAKVSAEDNAELHEKVIAVTFVADGSRWGLFKDLPGDQINALVRTAIRRAGDVVPFLRAMVSPQVYLGVTWELFQSTWEHSPATKNYVKGLFRDIAPGHHEWIPTGYIPQVIKNAIDIKSTPTIVEGFRWVVAQSSLRSPTPWVLHHPTVVDVEEQGQTTQRVALTGHTGAFRIEREGELVSAGTIGTQDFHEWLRQAFSGHNAHGAAAYVWYLASVLPERVWDGSTGNLPQELLQDPVGMLYRTEPGVDESLTIAALAAIQRRNWLAIGSNFADTITAIEQENGT
ncbi:hypothetical protein [Arthrobacter sp. JSM 101049]|uniref:hypothetical protein n=1 Tax=Arthrobacter sp. JSM 101049 TaxID=929097 RepID=UPI00356714F9